MPLGIRMLLGMLIGALATWQWWFFNQDRGNLAVVDRYVPAESGWWWTAATVSVLLSLGLLFLHLSLRWRNQQREMQEDGAPPLPRGLLMTVALLSTVLDVPVPSYGVWLSNGWPSEPRYWLAAFLLGGLWGSTICQILATEAWLDVARVVGYWWTKPVTQKAARREAQPAVRATQAAVQAAPKERRKKARVTVKTGMARRAR